jgi:hypothetical protein
MKQLLIISLFSIAASAQPIVLHTKAKPPKQEPIQSAVQTAAVEDDDDVDGQVVLANVANMLGCIGMLSTDPYNPAIAGPSLAQIGVSFINIITQIFKSHGFDDELTRARLETWFMQLPDQTKKELISLFIQYAQHVRSQQYAQCECDCGCAQCSCAHEPAKVYNCR